MNWKLGGVWGGLAVAVGSIVISGSCGAPGSGCDRPAGREDTTYGYFGPSPDCREGLICAAKVGEVRGGCGLPDDRCEPGPPPYRNGYFIGPSPNCPSGKLCEMRGAPPLRTGYYGNCVTPPGDPAPPPNFRPPEGDGGTPAPSAKAEVVSCDKVPNAFAHEEGRAVDYLIDCDLEIDKPVTIGPGTVLALGSGRSVRVGKKGSLSAVGTEDARIVFQRASKQSAWGSVIFFSDAEANELSFVDFRGGGSELPEGQAQVIVGAESFSGGEVSIRDCVFDGSEGAGLSVGQQGVLRALERTSILDSSRGSVRITANQVQALGGTGNDFGTDGVFVREDGPPIDATVNWKKLSVPYNIVDTVELRGAHTLAPGVSLVMGKDANLRVAGTLIAKGTANALITVSPDVAMSGRWGGIHIQTGGNEFSFVSLKQGGGKSAASDPKGMISLDPNVSGAAVSIRDCVFEGSEGYGVVLAGVQPAGTLEADNTFEGNAQGNVSP